MIDTKSVNIRSRGIKGDELSDERGYEDRRLTTVCFTGCVECAENDTRADSKWGVEDYMCNFARKLDAPQSEAQDRRKDEDVRLQLP